MTGQTQMVPATKAEAKRFLAKAEQFLLGAQGSLRDGHATNAGLLSVHAAISACDALTGHFLGVRSKSQRHQDVMGLLKQLPLENKEGLSRQVRRLLDDKNVVEYEDKLLLRTEANEMVELAERIVATCRKSVR